MKAAPIAESSRRKRDGDGQVSADMLLYGSKWEILEANLESALNTLK